MARAAAAGARGKEGWICKRRPTKRVFSQWKRRYAVLLGTRILYFERNEDSPSVGDDPFDITY